MECLKAEKSLRVKTRKLVKGYVEKEPDPDEEEGAKEEDDDAEF